jgi:FtsP/CotA-like multicopper oxidase with cupredoxin domain
MDYLLGARTGTGIATAPAQYRSEALMPESRWNRVRLSRREFVADTLAGGFALVACGRSTNPTSSYSTNPTVSLDKAIAAAEAARPHTGRTVTATLTPQPAMIDLGGANARTLANGSAIPGPPIRANVGDEVAVTVTNRLDHPTSVHWHGIALRNDMDGADPASPNIDPGRDFTYRFSVPHPGTYWAHPHAGLDADYGLYLPVIVDDPLEPGDYDGEWIVMLDDWTDGIGKTPQAIYDDLRNHRMGHMGMMSGVGTSSLLGGDAGDVSYPYYLINGRIPAAPTTFTAKPGQRIRIRIINAGSDTAFRVALAGHSMTVTQTDGYPVVPTEVDAVLLGMSERYDVIVTAGDGVFPLVAAAEGKNALARALLSTGAGTAPDAGFLPAELNRRVGTVDMFSATPQAGLGTAKADLTLSADLSGGMMSYDWAINGQPYPNNRPLTISQGQRATLTFTNRTMMWHPMHLHGHTFQIIRPDGSLGARKDSTLVLPMRTVSVALVADNPGIWMLHCHNTYHQEAGMMTSLNYVS